MERLFNILIFSLFFVFGCFAQSNSGIVPDTTTQNIEVEKKLELKKKMSAAAQNITQFDTLDKEKAAKPRKIFIPDPNKSVWYGLLFPGAGQIYNRRYWKLPIVYGGFAAFAYGINYNGRLYSVYLRAYRDFMDNNEATNSFIQLERNGIKMNEDNLQRYVNGYRRNRDLCIIGTVAFYAITVLDAFVDAALADFDISPNLSMKMQPAVITTQDNTALAMMFKVNF